MREVRVMNEIGELIVMTSAVVLLPLVPAFLLYRFLPAETHVTGPFKGLSIQLTGAFAGYFILTLGTGGFIAEQRHEDALKAAQAQLWAVRGVIKVPPGADSPQDADIDMLVRPPDSSPIASDGSFDIEKVPLLNDPQTQLTLEVRMRSREPQVLHFWHASDDALYRVTYDSVKRVIDIGNPIVLTPTKQPYRPAAPSTVGVPVPTPDTLGH